MKFGLDIEDGPSLRTDHKTTPKMAWRWSRDPISKFWDLLITLNEKRGCYNFRNGTERRLVPDFNRI